MRRLIALFRPRWLPSSGFRDSGGRRENGRADHGGREDQRTGLVQRQVSRRAAEGRQRRPPAHAQRGEWGRWLESSRPSDRLPRQRSAQEPAARQRSDPWWPPRQPAAPRQAAAAGRAPVPGQAADGSRTPDSRHMPANQRTPALGQASAARRPGGVARAAVRSASAPDVRSATRSARHVNSVEAVPGRAAADRPGTAATQVGAARRAAVPWYERARSSQASPGYRHCGHLEPIVHRSWSAGELPPAAIVQAVDRLAELPQLIKERLAAGLDAIYLGPGGVPDLDDMGALSGVPLPSGRATWDACAGAYGQRKIIVGSRPSPTPDVMCHEIGHALDDIDGAGSTWQSDSEEFVRLYGECLPLLNSSFHRHTGPLGRREFFADAFAAIASGQRPALVEMVSGDTRTALNVMLYFNVRYGI